MTASSGASSAVASCAAYRRAATDELDPSTPTTMRSLLMSMPPLSPGRGVRGRDESHIASRRDASPRPDRPAGGGPLLVRLVLLASYVLLVLLALLVLLVVHVRPGVVSGRLERVEQVVLVPQHAQRAHSGQRAPVPGLHPLHQHGDAPSLQRLDQLGQRLGSGSVHQLYPGEPQDH